MDGLGTQLKIFRKVLEESLRIWLNGSTVKTQTSAEMLCSYSPGYVT